MPASDSIEPPAERAEARAKRAAQVRELFDMVADLDAGERAAALEARCAGDPQLRAEVESLLAHDVDDASVVLRSPLLDREHLRAIRRDDAAAATAQKATSFRSADRRMRRAFVGVVLLAAAAAIGLFVRDGLRNRPAGEATSSPDAIAREFLRNHLYGGAGEQNISPAATGHAFELSSNLFEKQPQILATVRLEIGRAYEKLGDHRMAVAALQPSALWFESAFGPSDQRTLAAQTDLARACGASGRLEDEGELLEQVVRVHREQFDADDSRTLEVQYLLAQNRIRLGRSGEAQTLLRELYDRCVRVRGESSALAVQAATDLASTLVANGQLDEGAALLSALLDQRRRASGPTDGSALRAMHDLASLHARMGEPHIASPLFQQAFDGRRALHGDDHPDVLASLDGLAHALEAQGLYDEAAMRYRHALEVIQERGTDDDSATLAAMTNLCRTLIGRSAFAEAEPLTRSAVEVAERTHTGKPLILGTVYAQRGETLLGLGRSAEAEAALLRAVDEMERRLGPGHVRIAGPVNLLITLYERAGRTDDAALWRRRLGGRGGAADG